MDPRLFTRRHWQWRSSSTEVDFIGITSAYVTAWSNRPPVQQEYFQAVLAGDHHRYLDEVPPHRRDWWTHEEWINHEGLGGFIPAAIRLEVTEEILRRRPPKTG